MIELIELAASTDKEICGVVFKDGTYKVMENIADDPFNNFEINVDEIIPIFDDVDAIFHSHPCGTPYLTAHDLITMRSLNKDFILIVGGEIKRFHPHACLIGRKFKYGKHDCAKLVEHAFQLGGHHWSDEPRGKYRDDIANEDKLVAGMKRNNYVQVKLKEVKEGDIILITSSGAADHMLLYIGNHQVIHHAATMLSVRDYIGEEVMRCVHSVWRNPEWEDWMLDAIKEDFKTYDYSKILR